MPQKPSTSNAPKAPSPLRKSSSPSQKSMKQKRTRSNNGGSRNRHQNNQYHFTPAQTQKLVRLLMLKNTEIAGLRQEVQSLREQHGQCDGLVMQVHALQSQIGLLLEQQTEVLVRSEHESGGRNGEISKSSQNNVEAANESGSHMKLRKRNAQ